MTELPPEFFGEAWQHADHPMAAVDPDNRFIRVNHAFERLLGYSSSELRGRTWMEFTRKEHVGGDLASVQDIIDGRAESYQLEKDYLHKRGHYVSIVLRVRRFPSESHLPLVMFSVEAPVATATRPEIHDVERHVLDVMRSLQDEVRDYKRGVVMNVNQSNQGGDNVGHNKVGGDMTGGDKTTNSDKTLKLLIGGVTTILVAVVIGFIWFAYYIATTAGGNPNPTPPPANIGEQ